MGMRLRLGSVKDIENYLVRAYQTDWIHLFPPGKLTDNMSNHVPRCPKQFVTVSNPCELPMENSSALLTHKFYTKSAKPNENIGMRN